MSVLIIFSCDLLLSSYTCSKTQPVLLSALNHCQMLSPVCMICKQWAWSEGRFSVYPPLTLYILNFTQQSYTQSINKHWTIKWYKYWKNSILKGQLVLISNEVSRAIIILYLPCGFQANKPFKSSKHVFEKIQIILLDLLTLHQNGENKEPSVHSALS